MPEPVVPKATGAVLGEGCGGGGGEVGGSGTVVAIPVQQRAMVTRAGRAIEGFGSNDQPPPSSKRSPRWLSPRWLAGNALGSCARRAAAPAGGHGQFGESLSTALHELAQHCGGAGTSSSGQAAEAARLVCRAANKVFRARADGALVDDWGCCQIVRAAVAVHDCALRRGCPAARQAVYQGYPEVFRIDQLKLPREVAVSGCTGAAAAVTYCAFLNEVSALFRFYPALDVAAGTRLYGEREREGDVGTATFSYSARAEAIREALAEGGGGRPLLAKALVKRIVALQAATGEATAFSGEGERLVALERRTCPLRPVGEHSLARRAQIAICSDALQLLQHEWDACERLLALTVDWPGDPSAGGETAYYPLQLPSRKDVEELVATTRQSQRDICNWGEALKLGRGGDALSMSRMRVIRERENGGHAVRAREAPGGEASFGRAELLLCNSKASIPSSVEAQPPSEAGSVAHVQTGFAEYSFGADNLNPKGFDGCEEPPMPSPVPCQSQFPVDFSASNEATEVQQSLRVEPAMPRPDIPDDWLPTFAPTFPTGTLSGNTAPASAASTEPAFEIFGGRDRAPVYQPEVHPCPVAAVPPPLPAQNFVTAHTAASAPEASTLTADPPAAVFGAPSPPSVFWTRPQEQKSAAAALPGSSSKPPPSFTLAGQFSDLNPFAQI